VGEAKRRGTREERMAAAVRRETKPKEPVAPMPFADIVARGRGLAKAKRNGRGRSKAKHGAFR